MSDQASLFDLPEPSAEPVRKVRVKEHVRTVRGVASTGEQLAEEGRARAEANADAAWRAAAGRAVQIVAATHVTFTTDEVHQQLDSMGVTTHDTRALGAVLKAAAKSGWCTQTDNFRASKRPEAHARPQRVWLSSIAT